jgi:hypothetical protein
MFQKSGHLINWSIVFYNEIHGAKQEIVKQKTDSKLKVRLQVTKQEQKQKKKQILKIQISTQNKAHKQNKLRHAKKEKK